MISLLSKRASVTRLLALASLAAATTLAPGISFGQAPFPSRPIRLIVPFAPGGATDIFARIVGQALQERVGQAVVVENRTGAGGTIAANTVAKAPGDGYTLLIGDVGTNAIAPSLNPNLPYDTVKDFKPITLAATVPLFLILHPSVKANTVQELIALAKANPNKLNFASSGAGHILHLASEMMKLQAGLDIVHVPYKGGGQTFAGLVSGETQFMFATASGALPHIKAGSVKAIAVASEKRAEVLPDVPTMIESGLKGFVADSWYGVFAPASTSTATAAILSKEFRTVLLQETTRKRLEDAGFTVLATSPEEFAAFIQKDTPKWAATIKAAGVKPE